ncbi:MAG: carboxypeptidase regulatory-like domain-containing protein, partial [Terriglobia bacterium]
MERQTKTASGSWLVLALGMCVFVAPARAQVDRGSMVGTVRDSSGAVVPGAAVTIANVATGLTAHLSTDASGNYTANLLQIGSYSVIAEKPGFRKTARTGVTLGVNETIRVDLVLSVGAVAQTVEVTAAPPLIQSQTSYLGTIETSRRIVVLPLNGRDFIQLAYLGPGANSGMTGSNASGGVPENERANEAISVNGLRVTDNNFLLDGLDNNEFGLGGVVVLPPPDAIQEFSTEENGMSAEFGRGGAAINVALKAGTNEFHGDAYEFLRNDALDARNFFDINRAPFHRNQYGFTFGGPIRKDRTFFFIDYQATRIREGLTFLSTVPTAKMRNGDFTELATPIYDPLSTDPATGARSLINPSDPMVIPASRINSAGQKVTNLYPLPNLPGIFN